MPNTDKISDILIVSIPFPGFVSNQVYYHFSVNSLYFVSIPFPGFVSNQATWVTLASMFVHTFQSRFQDSFQIKRDRTVGEQQLRGVSIPFPGFVSNQAVSGCRCHFRSKVSIPFPGFVSNQGKYALEFPRHSSRFNPVSRIRFKSSNEDRLPQRYEKSFNPVSRIRFKSSCLVLNFGLLYLSFNPVSRIRFKSSKHWGVLLGLILSFQSRFQDSFQIKSSRCLEPTNGKEVSIPFPGFVSNQENRT